MIEIVTSDRLAPLQHGFFTRKGGASSGVFAGLNCGLGSSDQSEIVRINRTRVANAMDATLDDLVTVHQTHSNTVVTVDSPLETPRPEADAIVTRTPGLVLAILTADCLPVLFADHEARVIAVAHAGWKGARDGILEATLDSMEAIGAKRENTVAIIGPSISQRAYEVGPEFHETFVMDDSDNNRFFAGNGGEKMLFDLQAYGLARLRGAGIGDAEWTRHCTYGDPARFYSYRRTTHAGEADYGRLISTIRL